MVIVAAREYRRMSGATHSLLDTLLNAPRGEPLKLKRSRKRIRDAGL